MTDIRTLIDLGIQIEGMLRILDRRSSAEAIVALNALYAQYSLEMKAFLAECMAQPDELASVHPVQPAFEAEPLEEVSQEAEEQENVPEFLPESEPVTLSEPEVLMEMKATRLIPEPAETEPAEESDNDEPVAYIEPEAMQILHPDLAHAFTLNDRFLFIRELFEGNTQDFNDTVALLSQLPSFADARDYLLNDLMLDEEDANVRAFLEVVEKNMK